MTAINTLRMDSKVVRDNDIVFNVMDGETVMINLERGEYYGLNPIGSRIWGMLETPQRVSDLCVTLQPDFDVSADQCAKDVLIFLNQLAEKGILQILNA